MLDVEKYKDLTLRVCYNKWPTGTKCMMSNKGNITTKEGTLIFYRTTLERNPDLLNMFFDVNHLSIFTNKEINFIKSIINLFKLPDSAYIVIEDTTLPFTGEHRTYLYIKNNGYVLLRFDLIDVDILKRSKILNIRFDVKEFKDATIMV